MTNLQIAGGVILSIFARHLFSLLGDVLDCASSKMTAGFSLNKVPRK
jgi:hypothetical protein